MAYHRLDIDELNKVVQIWRERTGKTDLQLCAFLKVGPTWLSNLRGRAKDGAVSVNATRIHTLRPLFDELGIAVESVLCSTEDQANPGLNLDELPDLPPAHEAAGRGAPDSRRPDIPVGPPTQPDGRGAPDTPVGPESSAPAPQTRYTRDEAIAWLIDRGSFSDPPRDVELDALAAYMGGNQLVDDVELRGFERLVAWLGAKATVQDVPPAAPAGFADPPTPADLDRNDDLADLVGEVFDARLGDVMNIVKDSNAIERRLLAVLERTLGCLDRTTDQITKIARAAEQAASAEERIAEPDGPAEPTVIHRGRTTTVTTVTTVTH